MFGFFLFTEKGSVNLKISLWNNFFFVWKAFQSPISPVQDTLWYGML